MIKFNPSKNKYFDFRIGIIGGVIMGLIVFFINYFSTSDVPNSLIAAFKQGIYTFFFGGVIMKLCETLAIRINLKTLAIVVATLVPSVIAIGLTFGLHSIKGTPLPLESTIPTAMLIVPSTFFWASRHQNFRSKSGGATDVNS